MRIESNWLILETTKCNCTNGLVADSYICKRNNIPQRGRSCPLCKATTKNHNYLLGLFKTCVRCRGTTIRPETIYDYLPAGLFSSLNFNVSRGANESLTLIEGLLGLNSIVSVMDYGAHHKLTDDGLIEKVRALAGSIQAINIVIRPTLEVGRITIISKKDGYVVKALK